MIILVFGEAVQKLSLKLYGRPLPSTFPDKTTDKMFDQNFQSYFVLGKFRRRILRKLLKNPHVQQSQIIQNNRGILKVLSCPKFNRCLHLFRVVTIMIHIGNKIVSEFLVILIGMGIASATASGYLTIKFYNKLPLFIFLGSALILPLNLFLNFFLVYFASAPNTNGKRFKQFWKRDGGSQKIVMLQLESCPSIGYNVGLIRNATNQTALSITDIIFNGLATAVLMKAT